jgi:SAM-dependent methyltransferase
MGHRMGIERWGYRACPVCDQSDRDALFHQHFLEPEGQELLSDCLVCVCRNCGMAYADGIPPQSVFDLYYQERSKYEFPEREGEVPPHFADRFNLVAEAIKENLPDRRQRILEVGASTGAMLSALKDRGYESLLGLDPSPACKTIAERHEVRVDNVSLADLAGRGESFDLVLLLAVLEHVRDVKPLVDALAQVMAPGASLFIQVPDAAAFHRWPDAPYQHFSTEHINFFARRSLGNLVKLSGFEEEESWEYEVSGGPGCTFSVLDMLFRFTGRPFFVTDLVPDEITGPALRKYIVMSEETDASLDRVLKALARSGREIIVWGVGTHTQRLLAEGRMEGMNIVAYVDSNTHLQGTRLGGKPILAPAELKGRNEPILISSRVCQEDIRSQILDTLGLPNEIITLYEL